MPETTINKYNRFILQKNQVRLARQSLVMKFVSETFCEQKLSDENFRFCVLAPDPRHIKTSGFFIMNICHRGSYYAQFFSYSLTAKFSTQY